jgi:hypothetical protein
LYIDVLLYESRPTLAKPGPFPSNRPHAKIEARKSKSAARKSKFFATKSKPDAIKSKFSATKSKLKSFHFLRWIEPYQEVTPTPNRLFAFCAAPTLTAATAE